MNIGRDMRRRKNGDERCSPVTPERKIDALLAGVN
jgi:hypothetical protein